MKTISILDDLYYDNISVQNLRMPKNTEYKKRMVTMCETEKYLSEHLKGRFKSEFERFGEAWNFINDETNKAYFIAGFRMGAKIAYEVFCEKT